jgi:hypothetical protein
MELHSLNGIQRPGDAGDHLNVGDVVDDHLTYDDVGRSSVVSMLSRDDRMIRSVDLKIRSDPARSDLTRF